MADQAFSNSEDLMFGSGELYILYDDEVDLGWKHLGNADEFIINTELESIKKYGSMNKKRELQDMNTTQATVTAYATLTEYDPKNLALALFGEVGVKHQVGRLLNRVNYVVPTVPGIVTVADPNMNRYYGIRDVLVEPTTQLQAGISWFDANGYGEISTVTNYHDTLKAYSMGGKITVTMPPTGITSDFDILLCITKPPSSAGDLYGMEIMVQETNIGETIFYSFNNSTLSEDVTLTSGAKLTFEVTGTATFSSMGTTIESGVRAIALTATSEFKEGIDYICDEQDSRAGIIKIPFGSRVRPGDAVSVSCIVPDRDLQLVSGVSRKECQCKLLYVPDNNVGPNYVLEAWRVRVEPEGDLTGLISSGDFGTYRINFEFITDYEEHPGYPYFQMTLIDYGYTVSSYGSKYNANY